jgi:hypothetical protein
MTSLYPLLSLASLIVTGSAYLLAPLIALFVQPDGNLPRWLKWYQPSDNLVIGDCKWISEHPTYSSYMLALTYMWRNPAQGYDQLLKADVPDGTSFKVRGNPNIKDGIGGIEGNLLITTDRYFHLTCILDLHIGSCARSEFGWRLGSLVGGYQHKTRGQIVCTPLRFYKFTKG